MLSDFLKDEHNIISRKGHVQMNKEQADILSKLVSNHKIKNVLEIGFNYGHSSEIFLKNNSDCKVVPAALCIVLPIFATVP